MAHEIHSWRLFNSQQANLDLYERNNTSADFYILDEKIYILMCYFLISKDCSKQNAENRFQRSSRSENELFSLSGI